VWSCRVISIALYALAVAPALALLSAGLAADSFFSLFGAESLFSEASLFAAAGSALSLFSLCFEPFELELSDFRLSLMYQPEPLKTTPTG
jgi:hypothetical protein